MKKSACKTGNKDATRDVCMIVLSAALMTAATVIDFGSFIVLAILRYNIVWPFSSDTGQRDSWTCIFQTFITFLLFAADLILIQIFWNYVINVNKTINEIERATSENRKSARDTIKSIGSALGIQSRRDTRQEESIDSKQMKSSVGQISEDGTLDGDLLPPSQEADRFIHSDA